MKNWLLVLGAKIKKIAREQVSVVTLTKLNELLIKELFVLAGDTVEAQRRIFEGACQFGHEFMLELAPLLEKNPERIPAYGRAAWLMFAGHAIDEVDFSSITYGEYECYRLILRDYDCPFCRNLTFSAPACTFAAGAYQGAAQTWAELTDNPLNAFTRESKCKAMGDDCCELTLLMVPKDMPLSVLQEAHPKWFEYIQTGFLEV